MNLARRVLSIVLLCAGLAACFTSTEPLIDAAGAEFPFDRIVFAEVSRPDDPQTWTRKGDAYAWRPDANDDGEAVMRLMQVSDDLYLVQMEFTENGGAERLYGLVKPDLPANRAYAYATLKPDRFEIRPGLALCDASVCIEDIDAYVAYAEGLIAAGAPPDAEYRIIEVD